MSDDNRMDKVEKIARANHKDNDARSEPEFRVAWEDCLPAYREMLMAEARETLNSLEALASDDTALPFGSELQPLIRPTEH